MKYLKLQNIFLIAGLVVYVVSNSYSGTSCPANMISDHRMITSNSTNKDYDCMCPDFRALDFNLANNPKKIGICRDNYEYKLDVSKFTTGASGSRLVLWLDAYSVDGKEFRTHDFKFSAGSWVSNSLSLWVDKSGNNYNASQATALNQPRVLIFPTTSSAAFTNANAIARPMVAFNEAATPTYMFGTIPAGIYSFPSQFICFIIARFYDAGFAGSQEYIFSKDGGGAAGFSLTRDVTKTNILFNVNTTTPTAYVLGNAIDVITFSGSSAANDTHLIVMQSAPGFTGSNIIFYLNPYQQTYNVDLSPNRSGRQIWDDVTITGNFTDGTTRYALGSLSSTLGSNPARVGIGEVIVFEKNLTHGERREIEMYLRKKWGITQNNLGG